MEQKKWEYAVELILRGYGACDNGGNSVLVSMLNKYGQEGWELVSTTQLGDDTRTEYLFKRPV